MILGTATGKAGKVLLGKLDQFLVRNSTSANENHAVSGIVVLDVVDELRSGNVADVLTGTQDGPPEGLVLESGGVQVVKDDFLKLLVHLFLFSENDVALAFDGRGLKFGVLENVCEDIDGGGDIRVEGFGVVYGVLALFGPSACIPEASPSLS